MKKKKLNFIEKPVQDSFDSMTANEMSKLKGKGDDDKFKPWCWSKCWHYCAVIAPPPGENEKI